MIACGATVNALVAFPACKAGQRHCRRALVAPLNFFPSGKRNSRENNTTYPKYIPNLVDIGVA
jgi:hypothetical protein